MHKDLHNDFKSEISMTLQDTSLIKQNCLINGKWQGTPENSVINPANQQEISKVPNFGEKDTINAIQYANAAFKTWSEMLAKERSQILRNWFSLIKKNAEDLAKIITLEQGKPIAEARGEIAYAATFVEFYAEEAKRIYGETIPTHIKDARIIVTKQPIGVAACITPWNFPSAMITRKVSPALAAGCTVIVKPAPETPLSALALGELAIQAGIPSGALQIITGDAVNIGKAIMESKSVKAISFTGSTDVGKLLMRQAADTVKKVSLELGGNAPFIVFDDANINKAVDGAIASKFRNMGQTCVCANRIFVQTPIYDEFIEKLTAKVKDLKLGDGLAAGVTQGPLINAQAIEKSERHIKDAVEKGAELILGGNRHELGGTFFQPTILKNVTMNMAISTEETFGPVAGIHKFDKDHDVIEMANDTDSGLAAYFYAQNIARIWKVAEKLEYGMVGINSGIISNELAPFGGVKESGLGREGSHHGMDEFLEMKYLLMGGLENS